MNENPVAAARAAFPPERLASHRGKWIAFNDDVSEIVASEQSLERLEAMLADRRINPESVFLEFIPGAEGDMLL